LVGEPPRPWTATALEDCQTLAVPATQLVRLFRTNPTLAMNLARYTSLRYAAIATALDNTVRGRVRERLLGALRRLAWQYGFDPPPAGRSRSD
jgi:CRP-like cAMP-binding protein